MARSRVIPLAAIGAAIVALGLPAGALAQGGGPFPNDQQPISDEYGLPPLDHPAHSGGGAAGGGGGSNGAGTSGAGSAASSLSIGDVRRGEGGRASGVGGSGRRSAHRVSPERVGIGNPVPPSAARAADPRGGFDVLLLVLAGLAAAGLVVAGLAQLRRPGRLT